jgi:prevent-host-death family protein
MYHKHTPQSRPAMVREVASSEFKNTLHELLDRVAQGNEEIVITRYGRPVARLCPLDEEAAMETKLFGCMAGTVTVVGDIVAPLDEAWDADAGVVDAGVVDAAGADAGEDDRVGGPPADG